MRERIFIAVMLIGVLVAPLVVFGALVPCGGTGQPPCTLCHIYVLAQNILNFLMWTAAPLLAALGIAWGGFKILISGTNPGLRQDGFRILKTVLWGLLIVFGAWIIINELLLFFAGSQQLNQVPLPWNQVQCR